MMINLKTGIFIKQPEGIEIIPSISEKDFKSLAFEKDRFGDYRYQVDYVRHRDVLYSFTTIDDDGNPFHVRIVFSANNVENWKYHISNFSLENEQVSGSYPDFRERLSKTKEWHDNWMKKNCGSSPSANYWWGTIESSMSEKGEGSYIFLKYSKDVYEKNG